MKILIDMNLSPSWQPLLAQHGIPSLHWSEVGDVSAPDRDIMQWASEHGYVVLTNDLDFSAMLAFDEATAPSVVQIRAKNLDPVKLQQVVVAALQKYETSLKQGALITIDVRKLRINILPIRG
jgi:predicted nuclease of predicted toxin-antitoxin system